MTVYLRKYFIIINVAATYFGLIFISCHQALVTVTYGGKSCIALYIL
jgi:hypothetical protein